ncbi:MAG: glycosyltransferase family 9 protein [Dehalococcoidales bacterium]|jgi:ADP-heptose:LPS heptosyltransferase
MNIVDKKKILSFIYFLPFLILKKIFQKKWPKTIKKILVIQWDYLGDIILSTPALNLLKETYKSSEIHLLTSSGNQMYINNYPFVEKIIYINNPLHLGRVRFNLKNIVNSIIELRKESYDLIIELSGSLPNQIFLPFLRGKYFIGKDPTRCTFVLDRSLISSFKKKQIEENVDLIKLAANIEFGECGQSPLWDPTNDYDLFEINELKSRYVAGNEFVILHVAVSWAPRRWPLEKWVEVAEYLANSGYHIVFIGSRDDSDIIERIRKLMSGTNSVNLAGKTDIRQLILLMKNAQLFIGVDSGPMHLAAVAKLKGVVLFGPADPSKWSHPDLHSIVCKYPFCCPCPQLPTKDVCEKGFKTCKGLSAISSGEVIIECKKLLNCII